MSSLNRKTLPGFPLTARDARQAKGSRKSRKQARNAHLKASRRRTKK